MNISAFDSRFLVGVKMFIESEKELVCIFDKKGRTLFLSVVVDFSSEFFFFANE